MTTQPFPPELERKEEGHEPDTPESSEEGNLTKET